MTENTVFQLLLNNCEQNSKTEFANLQKSTVDKVSFVLADIIYETLKVKSTSSSFKRANILRYINLISQVEDHHNCVDKYSCYLHSIKKLYTSLDRIVENFITASRKELEELAVNNFSSNMKNFYYKKNVVAKDALKKIDLMKKIDEEKLQKKYDCQIRKKIIYYETNEKTLQGLINFEKTDLKNLSSINYYSGYEFREAQIQFAYALLNIQETTTENINLLQLVLNKIAEYRNLHQFEINFLLFLWTNANSAELIELIVNKFSFVYEIIVLKYCTSIIKLKTDCEAENYIFSTIDNMKNRIIIHQVFKKDQEFSFKIFSLLFELYFYSFCNRNILKLKKIFQCD